MKIGIDLDGVIFDSEKEYRLYSELYDMFELKRNSPINDKEMPFRKREGWNEEELENFYKKYSTQIIKECNYMPGAKMILKMLKNEGHELIIVTARRIEIEKEITEKRLEEDNMNIFDKSYFEANDKAEVCEKENIDIMIDDLKRNCEMVSGRQIKTIYFRDPMAYEMEENEYLKVLYNWGEIYRYIKSMGE